MIVCPLCGREAPSGARNCPQCGRRLSAGPFALGEQAVPEKSSIEVAAFAFYVISCVSISFFIVPLIWAIPATIYVKNRIDRREKISLLFKLFSFFFVSLIGGFILFFRDEALMRKPGEA